MDLLSRGVAPRHMAGLRHRSLQLFWRLLRDVNFNPASAQYQKVTDDGLGLGLGRMASSGSERPSQKVTTLLTLRRGNH